MCIQYIIYTTALPVSHELLHTLEQLTGLLLLMLVPGYDHRPLNGVLGERGGGGGGVREREKREMVRGWCVLVCVCVCVRERERERANLSPAEHVGNGDLFPKQASSVSL